MLTSLEVENFRGIERLSVNGLGRVNLIIGKNNSGKTALMEAAGAMAMRPEVGQWLEFMQTSRLSNEDADIADFNTFWSPLFHIEDAERGFCFKADCARDGLLELRLRKPQGMRSTSPSRFVGGTSARLTDWMLEYEVKTQEQLQRFAIKCQTNQGVTYPEDAGKIGWWIAASRPVGIESVVAAFSRLKQQGQDSQVSDLLRKVDERIRGVEILSPRGTQASVFARIAGESQLLPFTTMGDGIQRCFDIAVGLASEVDYLAIDEFENGLHHSVLEPMWKWLANASARRGLQIFATTHSEECVQAASQAFSSLSDDGLRVIRLDRQEHQTVATVYDRNLVEAAGRMGVEIRG